MDDGRPFRKPQAAPRRVATSRPAPVSRPVEDNPPVKTEPVAESRAKVEKPPKKKHGWKIAAVVAGVVLVLGLAWFMLSGNRGMAADIDSSRYQAVFFTNGQAYFGKLSASGNHFKLKDVYYVQNQQSGDDVSADESQATATDQSGMKLIKRGEEVHGPEDEMIIPADQVLFYENLKPSGQVSQKISEHKSNN